MSSGPASRQTLSYLMQRFEEVGLRPHAKYGQNFLIDLNLLDVLLAAAAVTADDVVLEVGTGMGSLTALLAQRAATVVTVEIDPHMFQLASEELEPFGNLVMLQVDALRGKNRLNPVVMEAVQAALAAAPGRRLKLVANLPYSIATPLLSNLLADSTPPQSMTVTIQKEVAERIVALPGTKDYGALSIWMQSQCRVEILRTLPPAAFWPRPKVASAFIQIEFNPALCSRISDRAFFHVCVRTLFCHRRKALRSVLLSSWKDRLERAAVDALLADLQIDGSLRAEQLDVETMIALSGALQTAIQG